MIDLGKFSDSIIILQGDTIEIKVARLRWDVPHRPITSWETFKYLPKDSSDDDIQKVVKELLRRKKYFKKCKVCSEVKSLVILIGMFVIHVWKRMG